MHQSRSFFPYGPEPYRSVGRIRRQVSRFLLVELIRWLVQTDQIDISRPVGRSRLRDGDTFADVFT